MLLTLLSWLYIASIAGTLGTCCHILRARCSSASPDSASPSSVRPAFVTAEACLLTGLALAGIYAQIFSLFGGVGALANLILAALCAALLFLCRKDLLPFLQGTRDLPAGPVDTEKTPDAPASHTGTTPASLLILILCCAAVLYCALIASQTPSHYDTYLYHAQAIRWIEEYGCVPGLGNLHNRFAYNSSLLVLQALFSLKFLTGTSLHTLNGFIAALFLCYSLCSFKALRGPGARAVRKSGRAWDCGPASGRLPGLYLSDALRVGLIYYLLHGSTSLSSPNTDTFALSLAFYIFIKWCDCLEEQEDHVQPYAWLCLMAVFACTLKLSSAFLLILLVKPISMIFRRNRTVRSGQNTIPPANTAEDASAASGRMDSQTSDSPAPADPSSGSPRRRPWREFAFYALCAAGIALPYFIRSVLISGYVLYPYSALDVIWFADWKMDAGVLDYDRLEIMAWGRGINDVTQMDQPITQWLPAWFTQQSSVGKREILLAAVSAAGLILTLLIEAGGWLSRRLLHRAGSGRPQTSAETASEASQGAESAGSRVTAGEGTSSSLAAWDWRDRLLFLLAALVCLAGWLFSAPLLRYGEIYLILVSSIFIISCLQRLLPALLKPEAAARTGRVFALAALCLILLRGGMMQRAYYPNGFSFLYQDYASYDCEAVSWNGVTIYLNTDSTQTGYDPFPAIFIEDTLEETELRGEDLADGFRLKKAP